MHDRKCRESIGARCTSGRLAIVDNHFEIMNYHANTILFQLFDNLLCVLCDRVRIVII